MTRLFILFPLLFAFTSASSQDLPKAQQDQIDKIVHWGVKEVGPGIAVGIVRAGEIIYERYAGLEDIKVETPIDENTVFNIASNAKQFTACLILELIQRGELQLSDDIRAVLPEVMPEYAEAITVQQLLNHSSGIWDVYELWSIQGIVWWKTRGLNNEKAFRLIIQQRTPQFQPGTRYAYSNSNYLLLAEMITRLTGQPFAEYAQKRLRAWGLEESFFLADHRQLIPNVAKPYFDFDKWYYYRWRSSLYGDGALFTTLRDQLHWEAQLQTQQEVSDFLVASQQPLLINGRALYGFGLAFDDYRGLPLLTHAGTTGAWKAYFMRFPEQGLAIVVMTNSGAVSPAGVGRRIAKKLLAGEYREEPPFPQGPETVYDTFTDDELVGTYALDNGFYFRIRRDSERWQLERPNRSPITIEREAGDLFHEVDDPAFKQHFARNDEDQPTLTAYYPSHAPYTLTKLEELSSNFQAQPWEGKYQNAETGVTVQLTLAEPYVFQLNFRGRKRHKRAGTLIGPTLIYAEGYGLQLLEKDGQQQMILTNNRIDNVVFVRVD